MRLVVSALLLAGCQLLNAGPDVVFDGFTLPASMKHRLGESCHCHLLLLAGPHSELPVPQRYAVAVGDARSRLA